MSWIIYIILSLQSCFPLIEAQFSNTTTQISTTIPRLSQSTSPIIAIIASCVTGAVIIIIVATAVTFIKIREKRQIEGSLRPRSPEQPAAVDAGSGAGKPPQLKDDGLTSQLLLSACLVLVALLLAIFLTFAALAVAVKRRASHGSYSPSRQEKEGSRVELWNMVQPPPMERLI